MTDPRTDKELLVASRVETTAFEELYRRHVGDDPLRGSASGASERRRRPGRRGWLEVVASLDRYEPHRGDALPWILGIAANLCATERRRRTREQEVVRRLGGRRSLDDDDYERLERAIDADTVAPALRQGLRELPPSERVVAELVLLDGLSPAEAAEALGIRAPALRMRLARARKKLQAVAEQSASSEKCVREVTW